MNTNPNPLTCHLKDDNGNVLRCTIAHVPEDMEILDFKMEWEENKDQNKPDLES